MNDKIENKKVILGAKWITASTLLDAIIQLLRVAILARFLTKSDFGIVAICTMVLGLTQVFADLGFSVGLMSRSKVTDKEFSSVFWFQFILFMLLYIFLSCLSPLIANFYNEGSLTSLIPISLLSLLFWGIGKLYDTVIHKNMQYKIMAVRSIVASLLSLIFAYVFCMRGLGIYSLLFSTLLYTAIVNIWNFVAGQRQFKLKFHLSFFEAMPYLKIGIYNMGTRILDYFSNQIDILIIGKAFDMQTLGVYNLTKSLALRVFGILSGINFKITLPILAKVSNNIKDLKNRYGTVVRLNAFICMPAFCMLIIFAKDVLSMFYGEKYVDSALLLQLISIIYMINSIVTTEGILTCATGQTRLDFVWTVVRVILTVSVVWITSSISVIAIVLGQISVAAIGSYFIWKYIVNKITQMSLRSYYKSFAKELLSAVIVIIMMFHLVNQNCFNIDNIALRLVVYFIIFAMLYYIVLMIFDRKMTNNMMKRLLRNNV